jgi:hypothetical protein
MEANTDKLHSLLFTEGRELVNIKFLPGSDRGLSPARLKEAAAQALTSAFAGDLINNPPRVNEACTLEDFLMSV